MAIPPAPSFDFSAIELSVEGSVAHLRLNRPEALNAINAQMAKDLGDALDAIAADDSVNVVLLTGNGRAFSSGYDLASGNDTTDLITLRQTINREAAFARSIWEFPKPIIAAVQGYCLGGACHVSMMCDITVAADDAQFGEPEIRMGGAATPIMPWLIGMKAAKEMLLTGKRIGADKALALGIINSVIPRADLEREALRIARQIALVPPLSSQYAKRAINAVYDRAGLRDGVAYANELSLLLAASPESTANEFQQIAVNDGLRAALAWQKARYAEFDER